MLYDEYSIDIFRLFLDIIDENFYEFIWDIKKENFRNGCKMMLGYFCVRGC